MNTYITTSWDDGHPLDLKLAELLNKYNVPATFYIPIQQRGFQRMNDHEIRQIAVAFDVGAHGYTHVDLTKITEPKELADTEIKESKNALENLIGKQVQSFSYPYGFYNRKVISGVKQAGFAGARTVKILTREWEDPFQMSTTICAVDWWFTRYILDSLKSLDSSLFLFMMQNALFFGSWDEIASRTLDFVLSHGGIWHLWGHSWEIEEHGDWHRLEEVLRRISDLPQSIKRMNNSDLLIEQISQT